MAGKLGTRLDLPRWNDIPNASTPGDATSSQKSGRLSRLGFRLFTRVFRYLQILYQAPYHQRWPSPSSQMAPSRRVARQEASFTAAIRGGIRRSGRGRRAAVQTADSDTIYLQPDQSLESTQSELSSSATLSDGTPDDDQVPAAAAPEPINLQTLNTILQ